MELERLHLEGRVRLAGTYPETKFPRKTEFVTDCERIQKLYPQGLLFR